MFTRRTLATITNRSNSRQVTKRKLDSDEISEEILADSNTSELDRRKQQDSKKFKPNVDSASDMTQKTHSSLELDILSLYS